MPDILGAAGYNDFLTNQLPQILPANRRARQWYMQDGAPAHQTDANKEALGNLFGSRLIALNPPHIWPPNSPDLNPFDFTIWGRAKSEINAQASQT